MVTIDPKDVSVAHFHNYLLGAVTPRPIALASTIDKEGSVNLSPFSFFNCFGANPPVLIFSPARRVRDNTTKHTLENILEVPEVVIHIVDYGIVHQTSLSSTEYPRGVNEFSKVGFTSEASVKIRPPRVREAPIAMECKVTQVIPTGEEGGAGNLVVCEILMMHIQERVLDSEGRIDPFKLDAVARLGGDWYARVQGDSIFKVAKPLGRLGIGVDQLPESIRTSDVLTGNDLARLGNVEAIPSINHQAVLADLSGKDDKEVHRYVHELIEQDRVEEAWQVLLQKTKSPY
jgi:flavin reductase (DIM6/NTAB) family NADH-FMN oxidoreductase RutF